MGSLEGCWRPGPSLLALASAGCEVLGESVPFGKALDNVDKVNAYGCFFCWEGLGLLARCAQVPAQICLPAPPERLLLLGPFRSSLTCVS